MKIWKAKSPSNIALIKYMGKTDVNSNRPANPSLSYTLGHLNSFVELSVNKEKTDSWEPLINDEVISIELNEKSKKRFLENFKKFKNKFGLENYFFDIKSANNFPQACGIASSASSFSALCMATYNAAKELVGADFNLSELSKVSQKASGSSCRSFFPEWAKWEEEGAIEVKFPYENLRHLLIVVDSKEKTVSSSQAHKLVLESPKFEGRTKRALGRLDDLEKSLNMSDWKRAYEICYDEFVDMHELFETSKRPFSYRTESSSSITEIVKNYWKEEGDGPIVTMDAGANVHLLFREQQVRSYKELEELFSEKYQVIGSL